MVLYSCHRLHMGRPFEASHRRPSRPSSSSLSGATSLLICRQFSECCAEIRLRSLSLSLTVSWRLERAQVMLSGSGSPQGKTWRILELAAWHRRQTWYLALSTRLAQVGWLAQKQHGLLGIPWTPSHQRRPSSQCAHVWRMPWHTSLFWTSQSFHHWTGFFASHPLSFRLPRSGTVGRIVLVVWSRVGSPPLHPASGMRRGSSWLPQSRQLSDGS